MCQSLVTVLVVENDFYQGTRAPALLGVGGCPARLATTLPKDPFLERRKM